MLTVLLSGKKSLAILQLPFSFLLCIEHSLEQLNDNLKGLLGLLHVLTLEVFVVSSYFQGSFSAAIIWCIEQGESLIFLIEGVSTFHYGSYTRQEQFFFVAQTVLMNSSYEKCLRN